MRRFKLGTILFLFGLSSAALGLCPPLGQFQSTEEDAWESTRQSLADVFDQCLLSSEYFSLLGAAQLKTGRLAEALESLERALLLDPDNGAAMIDYSEALLLDGQLFAAIEANRLLLSRLDIPPRLEQQIENRKRELDALTRKTDWQIDLGGGYDSNLNGAPDTETVALTLSGEPIFLILSENYQAVEGQFLNARVAARHSWLSPEHQDTLFGQVRGRFSEDSSSDVLQFAERYTRRGSPLLRPGQLSGALNHLVFLGNSLFTGAEASYKGELYSGASCSTNLSAAFQQQRWHQQRRLDGLEVRTGVEAACSLGSNTGQDVALGAGLLHNHASTDNRLGGNRNGWQILASWRVASTQRVLSAQINFTRILDDTGFSPLLANGARRSINRGSLFVQYRENLDYLHQDIDFIANFYHQNQKSNIDLFETVDTSVEVGISWRF